MQPRPTSHLRLARPSRDLRAAERFWTEGLGLEVLMRVAPEHGVGHPLVMVGWPTAQWHLELVGTDPAYLSPGPTDEDLLVLYVDSEIDPDLISRLVAAGGHRVASPNPYWEQWGLTIEDPDGYRLVLSTLNWPEAELANPG